MHRSARPTLILQRIGRFIHSQPPPSSLDESIRALLRHTAHPVVIITTAGKGSSESSHAFHGATLSSFTSISLSPLPLVACAIRVPSRTVSAIDASAAEYPTSTMVFNLLSSEQASIAHHFSRPDLFPDPFSLHKHSLTKEGIPIFSECLGALSCTLVASVPLDLPGLATLGFHPGDWKEEHGDLPSKLFVARVIRVESDSEQDQDRTPLLYHDRTYKTLGLPISIPSTHQSPS